MTTAIVAVAAKSRAGENQGDGKQLLAAALIPAEPTYSPHRFSDHLGLARQILVGSAAVYLAVFLLFRMLRALIAAPRHGDARRGFDVIAPNDDLPIVGAE
jgi:hypothetical protein